MGQAFSKIEQNISSIHSLSELFQLWQQAHEVDPNWELTFPRGSETGVVESFKSSFCIDGVSSLDGMYNGAEKAKVLFVLKESNIGQDEFSKDGTIHPFWFNEQPTHSTRIKYAKNFRAVLDRYNPQWESSAPIGYMNLNKRGGAGYTEAKRLESYVKQYQNFILKEIELISPRAIFLCGCEDAFRPLCGSINAQTAESHKEIATLSNNGARVYSIYHPSYSRFSDCLNKVPIMVV